MASQEYRIIAYLISAILGVSIYSSYVLERYQAGGFGSETIDSSWGWLVLSIIGVQIVLSVVMVIIATIVQTVLDGEEAAELTDERDQLIELRADGISYVVFGLGFITAMISLAAGQPPLIMFNIIVYSLFGAAIVGNITQIFFYRRGF